jgi:hypothetical protein
MENVPLKQAPYIVAANAIKEAGRLETQADLCLEKGDVVAALTLYSNAYGIALFARRMTPAGNHKQALQALCDRSKEQSNKLARQLKRSVTQ